MKTYRKLSLSLLCAMACATSSFAASSFGKVEVLNAPGGAKSAISESIRKELEASGNYDGKSAATLVVDLDGYFIRSGTTPAMLRQQGGRDVARGTLKSQSASGESSLGDFKVSLINAGHENLTVSKRQAALHKAIGSAVAKSVR